MYLPLYAANQVKKNFTVDNRGMDHANYFTILDVSYSCFAQKAMRLPPTYRLVAKHFGDLVKVCLT